MAAAKVAAATSSAVKPGLGGAAQHLGDDPCQRLCAASLRRSLGDVGARPVSTRDVARVGQTTIDRADRVGVYSQGRTKLAHGRQARAGQQPTGVDLVGQLPVDLGRDRNVRVALDIERPAGRPVHAPGVSIVHMACSSKRRPDLGQANYSKQGRCPMGAIVILGLMAVLAVFAALADRFGVDSRIDSQDPRRPVYPVGIS